MSNVASEPDLERLYYKLRLIRRAEEEVARIYPSDKIKSPVHLSIGQEAVAVGICEALRPDDVVSGTYRSHASYIAKGGGLAAMFAELYGKDTGCAHGKGGSMHLVDMSHYILGTSAVVGTTVPIALGYALALQREGRGRVVAAFFGDGATEEGVFYESLNFAALHRLPVLFVCENNFFAIHTHISKRWATCNLCERVRTYGIPTRLVADSDVLAIRRLAAEFIAPMRTGDAGPAFLECQTYRWREHVGPGEDYDSGYRSREELLPWQENDQMMVLGARLPAGERDAIDAQVEQEIASAIAFAENSPFPETKELYTHVYAG
jgi:pyruvate dehydrogenase E1 component alpha subunit